MDKKIKKLNLGFMKVEHYMGDAKPKQKFIEIERRKKIEPIDIQKELLTSLPHLAKKEKKSFIAPKQKPRKILKLMKEINLSLYNLEVFNALLIAIIIFLLSYIFLIIFNLNRLYSLAPPFIYFVVLLYLNLKENKYLKIEKKFPNLDEKLRAAADNPYMENPVVNELHSEIFHDMKGVDYASFLDSRKTSQKVLVCILLCFAVLLLAKYDVGFDLDLDKMRGFIPGGEGNATGILGDIISAASGGSDEDIYGDEYLAELGEEEITINMERVGYEINMNDVKDPSLREFEQSLFPDDVGLEEAEVYQKDILKENQELVKNYFKKLVQG
ncbi:MAG: hypothetical protein KAU20_00885 [Nanoarchaeota archaeon]|nr:hypothetical protein [Nanoarchaeota archaeon]